MDEIFSYHQNILKGITHNFVRSGYEQFDWKSRLMGIKGLRGVGKTTMLLQHIKFKIRNSKEALYVTADHPWFYENTLYSTISEWVKSGGKIIVIDEVHKYENWGREIKVAFDEHKDLQILYSASSAFDLTQSDADLSRRGVLHILPGLSFREYLMWYHNLEIRTYSLDELIQNHSEITAYIAEQIKPIPAFRKYLKSGYFPFAKGLKEHTFDQQINGLTNAVLENDLAYVQDYSPSNVQKIKKLLGVIAESAPFTPNISSIASKLSIGRNTVTNYLKHLSDAYLLNLIHKPGRGVSTLQKPDKIYFENTNLTLALSPQAQIGTLRETFILNQLKNAGHEVSLPEKGDFLIDDKIYLEVGGPNKSSKQLKGLKTGKAYFAIDNIEHGFGNRIPAWVFGFLY